MLKKLLFLPPVLLGVAAIWWVAGNRQPPELAPKAEETRNVRVVEVRAVDVVPKVTGFGEVKPAKVWKAVAQVAGEIEYIHPRLKRGAIMTAGTEIIRISPRDFELAIAQAEANIRAVTAQINELDVSLANTRASLEVEKKSAEIREGELERKKKLAQSGTISRTAFDQETRDALVQRKRVLDLENSIKLIPAKRAALVEQKKVNQLQAEQARINLSRTRITLPFDARIGEVPVEVAQYAQTGTTLVTADGIAVSEVEAQMPYSQFSAMASAVIEGRMPAGITPENIEKIVANVGFNAVVRLHETSPPIEWQAKFSRISESIDVKTRSLGVIVAVDDTYGTAIPGKKPPLSRGMFVEVELRARPLNNRVVVPRTAIRDGRVYLATAENRLKFVKVETGLVQGSSVIVDKGLAPGDRVIVSDLLPAIEGMLLRVVRDEALEKDMASELRGDRR